MKKKLVLKLETITKLTRSEQKDVRGGLRISDSPTCNMTEGPECTLVMPS